LTVDDAERSLRDAVKRAFASPLDRVDQRELYAVSLAGHSPTGFTTHRRDGEILPKPASLAIVQIDPDPGFYVLYLDEQGLEMADTYHTDLDRAFAQAAAEFNVDRSDWTLRQAGC
jgi:hypothetical protein